MSLIIMERTVSGTTDAITLKNFIDFRKWTVFLNFLKFDKNYLRHITSTTMICRKVCKSLSKL